MRWVGIAVLLVLTASVKAEEINVNNLRQQMQSMQQQVEKMQTSLGPQPATRSSLMGPDDFLKKYDNQDGFISPNEFQKASFSCKQRYGPTSGAHLIVGLVLTVVTLLAITNPALLWCCKKIFKLSFAFVRVMSSSIMNITISSIHASKEIVRSRIESAKKSKRAAAAAATLSRIESTTVARKDLASFLSIALSTVAGAGSAEAKEIVDAILEEVLCRAWKAEPKSLRSIDFCVQMKCASCRGDEELWHVAVDSMIKTQDGTLVYPEALAGSPEAQAGVPNAASDRSRSSPQGATRNASNPEQPRAEEVARGVQMHE